MNDTETATTIFHQLGGNRFRVMTGAKVFSDGPALLVHFPRKAGYVKNGIDRLKIELTPADEYRLTFTRTRRQFETVTGHRLATGYTTDTVKEFDGVYCDQLRDIIEDTTGLVTSL